MLNGRNNEEKIWNYLKGAGLNDCGAAGLMGNLYAESGLRPDNLQNTYEKKLGMTDASYTAAVSRGPSRPLCRWICWKASRRRRRASLAKGAARCSAYARWAAQHSGPERNERIKESVS